MQKLFESDFLTVNLKSLVSNKPDAATKAADSEEPQAESEKKMRTYPSDFDWGKELKKRLDANNKLDAESRETDFDVEKRFWYEYFTANWGSTRAKLLNALGEPLKADIKVLGFDKKINPIIGFLNRPYVQKELLQTNLLNARTYKSVVHLAVAKHLVADSEFFNVSDYNIIYCRDLYSKSTTEIAKYLELQHKSLETDSGKYTLKMQNDNKRAFLHIIKPVGDQDKQVDNIKKIPDDILRKISVTSKNIKLNDPDLVQSVLHKGRGKAVRPVPKGGKQLSSAVDNAFKTKEHIFAALQYIVMTLGNEKASNALSDSRLAGISTDKLNRTTLQVASVLRKLKVSQENVEAFVDLLLSKLDTVN